MIQHLKLHILLLGLVFLAKNSFAQSTSPVILSTDKDSTDLLLRIVAPTDSSSFLILDNQDQIQQLFGNVVVLHDSTFFRSDTAIVTNGISLRATGNCILNKSDSIWGYADSLLYDGKLGIAQFFSKEILLKNGDMSLVANNEFRLDLRTNTGTYTEGAYIQNDSVQVESKRGKYVLDEDLIYLEDSVIMVYDSTILTADSILFDRKTMTAHFQSRTRINTGQDALYCEAGYYDLVTKKGVFRENAQFIQGSKKGIADEIIYEGSSGVIRLLGKASVVDTNLVAYADEIVYHSASDYVELFGKAHVRASEGTMISDSLRYNLRTKALESTSRTRIENQDIILTANRLTRDHETSSMEAEGDILLEDKKNKTLLSAPLLYARDTDDYTLAYGYPRPMLTFYSDQDTVHIIADTFLRQRHIIDTILHDSIVYANSLLGYYGVNIVSKNFSGKANSLRYDDQDSIFSLLGDPVLWSDSAQIWGDSIFMIMDSSKVDNIKVRDNSRVMSYSSQSSFWNQIKGRDMDILFFDNSLDQAMVYGNAESIYFLEDRENKFIGCNQVQCAKMNVRFTKKQQIENIVFLTKPDGTFHKIKPNASGSEFRLDHIEDRFHQRPLLPFLDKIRSRIGRQALDSMNRMQ